MWQNFFKHLNKERLVSRKCKYPYKPISKRNGTMDKQKKTATYFIKEDICNVIHIWNEHTKMWKWPVSTWKHLAISHNEKVHSNHREYCYTLTRMAKLGLIIMNVSKEAKRFGSLTFALKMQHGNHFMNYLAVSYKVIFIPIRRPSNSSVGTSRIS